MAVGLLSINLVFSFILFHLFANLAAKPINQDNCEFARSLDPKILNLKKEKLTHMTFYWHDLAVGQNQTSIISVPPPTNTSATFFGQIRVMDDPLTAEPNRSSKIIGRSQGLYAYASQEEFDLSMVMNFVFTEGKYNGSSFTIVGWNNVPAKVREMPIVGGTGLFRFARGYVKVTSYYFIFPIANIKYDVYVLHY